MANSCILEWLKEFDLGVPLMYPGVACTQEEEEEDFGLDILPFTPLKESQSG